jgi:DDE superfamily endonuclease
MPKQARNTKRGSTVVHAKQLVQRQLEAALAEHAAAPALPLTQLARHHGVSYHMLWRAWRKYAAALAAGDADAMSDAAVNHRGGHNRTFTPLQESVLRDCVLAAAPAMGHQQIREAALQLAADVGGAGHRHGLRHRRAFTASHGFVSAFKQRNRLSSHRCALLHVSDREHAARDIDAECLDYVLAVQGAVDAYGAAMVLHMDETPSQMCDMPVTAVVRTGVKEPARIQTSFLTKHNITTFPCISAAGNKLQLCAIVKGKTDRSLRKITEGASAALRTVCLYKSVKGWMTTDIMVQWLRDVVLPYTGGAPAALLLDRYGCHWTREVRIAAADMNLALIQVPGGCTSVLQPLDVGFNGPMLKARQRIWRENQLRRPFLPDTYQAAVERTQLAYESMSKHLTWAAWQKAQWIN